MRATKIVATLGPASDGLIEPLLQAGVDVFRLNFSHGSHEEHAARIAEIRSRSAKLGRYAAVMADLQGPKIRISGFRGAAPVMLRDGADFCIDTELGEADGDIDCVGASYASLHEDVRTGDRIVLGDGLIELEVRSIAGTRISCTVTAGGELSANKGINLRGGGLSANALTDKDRADLRFACAHGVDYIALSFPRSADDMHEARALVADENADCGLVAKLERAESVGNPETLDALILASDAVMVARGDLGIEIGDAALMGVQKLIIARARALGRSVITATQMMESMIENRRPTRAEVMDVANAVLDGTDAVMLSAETAVGRYPVEAVESMAEVILGAEGSAIAATASPPARACESIDEAVAIAAITIAGQLDGVRAVACLTASGNTPKLMSRCAPRLPVYAMADDAATLARVSLFRGVHPVQFAARELHFDSINEAALAWLQQHDAVAPGDRVILTKGDYRDVQGGTNTLKIMEVGR